ncbi:hypothetical protein BpHYR1_016135 [Brachionus plicatilis]|uniref:Secreted protein n=1 Tax=Brachionus plicatilis TaxID=10195 RepID=A0A3M7QRG7_BRAPC|nr:hypothetical protein BpHYR1_016135 [Brachionus plicatilis]
MTLKALFALCLVAAVKPWITRLRDKSAAPVHICKQVCVCARAPSCAFIKYIYVLEQSLNINRAPSLSALLDKSQFHMSRFFYLNLIKKI